MIQFIQLAAYKTSTRRRGHPLQLVAKLAGSRIVFSGSTRGQNSIEADADINTINARWIRYCALNEDGSLSDLDLIEREMLDAARGKPS